MFFWGGSEMDEFMKKAIELATRNVGSGGESFGDVLVKVRKTVIERVTEFHERFDISGHAELNANRKVQTVLQTQLHYGKNGYDYE